MPNSKGFYLQKCCLIFLLLPIHLLVQADSPLEPHPLPENANSTITPELLLQQKLEQVFGQNFLKQYPGRSGRLDSSSPEEFETVEDEYLEERTTRKSIMALPPSKVEEQNTKFPILIPSEMDVITELEDSVVPEAEEGEGIYDSEEHDFAHNFAHKFAKNSSAKTKGRISTSAHFRRSCGDSMERCERIGREHGGRPDYINYARTPNYCRCDRGVCDQFGDCCWTVAATLLYRNPWKCHRVQHENTWALMISKCSVEYKSSPGADPGLIKSCESPLTIPPTEPYTHLHDIPVVTSSNESLNLSGAIYRNVFCSRCNNVEPASLSRVQTFLRCSKQFSNFEEREEFVGRAKYVRGKRIWIQDNPNAANFSANTTVVACGIFSPELDPRLLSISTLPGVRYCRKDVIDKCPKDFAKNHPLVAALCNSYTQIVESRPGFLFKNPHCAQCYGLDSKWDLRCLKEGVGIKSSTMTPNGKITPGAAGASLDSTGLSLLFDFDLTSGGNYVGYESTCGGDTMWDFLRQKCTATMCAKDHELDHGDGRCKPKEDEGGGTENGGPEQIKQPEDPPSPSNPPINETLQNNASLAQEGLEDTNATSSCYVLIVHDSEYILLPNNSVLVTITNANSKAKSPILFHPEEWKIWNSSSISICARELSSSFRQRFSPLLNYLSLSALGCSVFFSVLHILIFLLLPKMRNLPGKNLFCLTLSLLISQFLFLAFINSRVGGVCVVAAIFMHYFFLASFFWMNVMSFDIWRTFSTQFQRHSSAGNGGLFLKYSAWGWGAPLAILALSVSIDFIFAELDSSSETALRSIRPLYGHNNLCWIGQGLALFLFFALPAAILIALNIFLFAWTAKAILQQSQDAQKVFNQKEKGRDATGAGARNGKQSGHQQCSRKTSSSSEAEVQRMKLYMKLGVIMGVTWILGFLSGISEWEWLWYPFVLVNGLQGTFIFFGFDAKSKVWALLVERCRGHGASGGGASGGNNSRGAGNSGGGDEKFGGNRRSTLTTSTSTATSNNSTSNSTNMSVMVRDGVRTGGGGRYNRESSISHQLPI